jgi:5-methyltetrahydropteroyltriglutamate--homocysteine methyltransferase
MKTSTDRILTTHVGSLARPTELLDTMKEKEHGRPYDHALFDQQVREAVADRVRKQVENGIDIVTDGEMSKVSFLGYVKDRLGGFEVEEGGSGPAPSWQVEIDMFPEYYADYMGKYSAAVSPLRRIIARGPVTYVGHDLLQIDIDNLKAAVAAVQADGYEVADVFMPSSGPSGFGRNEYYASNAEYLQAVGEAMREEYRAIVDAGLTVQVDDAFLPYMWDLAFAGRDLEEYRKWASVRVDALNHALEGLPQEKVRYHICWGSFNTPHVSDVPLKDIVDLVLRVKAGAYCIEMGNPRHAHEWRVWETAKLPEGRKLVPGVISHSTNVVEHPELVAERLVRVARLVGRENVMAGTDCGFAQAPHVKRVHESVMWAKLETLAEGARIASRELWGRTAA